MQRTAAARFFRQPGLATYGRRHNRDFSAETPLKGMPSFKKLGFKKHPLIFKMSLFVSSYMFVSCIHDSET